MGVYDAKAEILKAVRTYLEESDDWDFFGRPGEPDAMHRHDGYWVTTEFILDGKLRLVIGDIARAERRESFEVMWDVVDILLR